MLESPCFDFAQHGLFLLLTDQILFVFKMIENHLCMNSRILDKPLTGL